MGFIDEIKAKAKSCKKTIVLPESEDIRTYEAAEAILKEGTANLVLIGSEEEIAKNKGDFDITGATIVDPATYEKTDEYVATLVELRKKKGMTEEQAREILLTNYLYYGVMMVKMKDADGMVSGACHSTADTLRPCLQILKTKPGTKLVSAFFVMVVPDCDMGENGTFVFADCGLNQNPTSEELAAIAQSSAESFKQLVGAAKAPGSQVAGKANTLIFPNLDAGNIGYKLVQRLAKAEAYGPMTQGIAAPVNDLSRGCSAKDIEGVVAITAVQCQNQ